MAPNRTEPWNPPRTWADLFIALLLLAILVLAGNNPRFHPGHARPPADQVSLQGRFLDAALGAARAQVWPPLRRWLQPERSLTVLAAGGNGGWDRALLAVHAGEAGDLATGATLIKDAPGPAGDTFRQAWTWCYQHQGAPPPASGLEPVRTALGNGYAARILEARLQARAGGDPRPLEDQARAWAARRLLAYSAAGLGILLAGLAGLGFGLHLAMTPVPPRPLPHFGMSGRAVLIVLLGWFMTLLAAGPAIGLVLGLVPALRPLSLPLVYACHACLGTAYLCWAEGISLGELWRRVAPAPRRTALAPGLGFLALAFTAVLAVSMVLGPMLHQSEPPQKELMQYLMHLRGAWTVVLLFGTVALLAPAFEELLFRGFLLPWLGERLGTRLGTRPGRLLAVALTGLGFAFMHLQPLGLPTLTTLGVVLGLAFLRTGNLVTSILVHGLWNGGVFLLMRLMA